MLTSISRSCRSDLVTYHISSNSIFMQLIGSVDATSARSLRLRRIPKLVSPLYIFFSFLSDFIFFFFYGIQCLFKPYWIQRFIRDIIPASSTTKHQAIHAFFHAGEENALGQTKQNKPKRSNLFSNPSFPSKYYQVTYTCPTYQNLTYPESTTMRHINVSMNV